MSRPGGPSNKSIKESTRLRSKNTAIQDPVRDPTQMRAANPNCKSWEVINTNTPRLWSGSVCQPGGPTTVHTLESAAGRVLEGLGRTILSKQPPTSGACTLTTPQLLASSSEMGTSSSYHQPDRRQRPGRCRCVREELRRYGARLRRQVL